MDALGNPSGDLSQSSPPDAGATVILSSPPTRATPVTTAQPLTDASHPTEPKRNRWVLPVLGTLTVLGGIGAFVFFSGFLSPPEPGETPPKDAAPTATRSPDESSTEEATPRPDDGTIANLTEMEPGLAVSEPQERALPATSDTDGAERDSPDSRIDKLLIEAEEQWQAGHLTDPVGNNAFETYRSILNLDPGHTRAREKLVEIGRVNAANKAFLAADRLLRQGEIDDARRMIETGLKMNPDDKRLLGLRSALD